MLLIFDCDGVLVDTETIQLRVLAQKIRALGGTLSDDEAMTRFRGHGMSYHLTQIEAHLGQPVPERFEKELRQAWEIAFRAHLRPLPGVAETLAQLPQRKCVASNGPRAKMALTLGLVGLRPFFGQRLYSAYDIGRWKPDPTLYQQVAAREGVPPTHCLVIEDSVAGVQAGVAAGMTVFGLADEKRLPELTAVGAHPLPDFRLLPHRILNGELP